MKLKKVLTSFVAAATAVTTLTAAVSAYTFPKSDAFSDKEGFDLGMSWAWVGVTVEDEPGFANFTADTVVKLTFAVDDADMGSENYWVIKPIVSDKFVDEDNKTNPDLEFGGAAHAEDPSKPGDSFSVTTDQTTLSFKVSPDLVEDVKANGIGFVGHRVRLLTLELVQGTTPPPATEDNKDDATNAEESKPADNNNSGNDTPKDPTNTGIEGVAVLMGVGILAGTAVVISKKRK